MDQVNTIDPQTAREAHLLARAFDYELIEDTLDAYDDMLCAIAQDPVCEQDVCFRGLAKKVCHQHYHCNQAEVQQTMGHTALLAIRILGLRVGDVEEILDISGGTLARLKQGNISHQAKLDPDQIVHLANNLGLTVQLLVNDFTNNMAELQTLLEREMTEPSPATEPTTATAETEPGTDPPPATVVEVELDRTAPKDDTPPTESNSRPSDAILCSHIRAAIKQSSLTLTEVMESTSIGNRMFITRVERGKAPLYDRHLEQIAAVLNIDVTQLLTGEGLHHINRPSNALQVVPGRTLTLPPITSERRQQYFRDLCLRRGVEPAEGQDIGELLEAAREEESIDWFELWSRVTAKGAKFRHAVDQTVRKVQPLGSIARSEFLRELHEQLFPAKDSEDKS